MYLQNHFMHVVESIGVSFGKLAALPVRFHHKVVRRGPIEYRRRGALWRRPHDYHLRGGVAVCQVDLLRPGLPQRQEQEGEQRGEQNEHSC